MRTKIEAVSNTSDKGITIFVDAIASFAFYTERATQLTLMGGTTVIIKLTYDEVKELLK